VPSAGPNAGIARFDARRSYSAPGGYSLSAEVVASPAAAWRGEALLYRDDKLVDARELELPAGGAWSHTWTETSRAESHHVLRLENTDGHRLALDKVASLTVPALPRPVVRVVGERQPFLEAALTALPELDFAWVEAGALAASDPLPPSTLWIFSATLPPEGFADGRRLLLLSPPAGAGFWGSAAPENARADAPLVTEWARDHPLFRHVDFAAVRPGTTRVFRPAPDAEILAASFETPVLFGRWDDRARWLVAPFDLAGGNLVFRTAFPILLANLLHDAPVGGGIVSATLPGATISRLAPGNAEPQLGSSVPSTATSAPAPAPAPTPASAFSLPEPWRLLLALALAWTLLEWRLYARRVTE
jgi:hypothetical protein